MKAISPFRTIKFWAAIFFPIIIACVGLGIYFLWPVPPSPSSVYVINPDQQTYTFKGNLALKNNTIITANDIGPGPDDKPVTIIAAWAFKDFTTVTSITLPNTIKEIHENAFFGCTALISIVIPESVMFIGHSAFKNCTSLTTIALPPNLEEIHGNTFENCRTLATITIPAKVRELGIHAFKDCVTLTEIIILRPTAVGISDGTDHTFMGSAIITDPNAKILVPPGAQGSYWPSTSPKWQEYNLYQKVLLL